MRVCTSVYTGVLVARGAEQSRLLARAGSRASLCGREWKSLDSDLC